MRVKITAAAASLMVGLLPGASFALGLGEIQLKSTLNSPLDAQIELIGATAEELNGLRAQLASRETFARYGLDYPAYLTGIQVRLVREGDRPVIELRSSAPMTEPFATLLVEVTYPRGRQSREYTVLLDPPVFAPAGAAAAAPIAAPVVGEGQRSGEVNRTAAAAPAPAPAAPRTPASSPNAPASAAQAAPVSSGSATAGGTYEVRRGDTLSKIASGIVGGEQAQQRKAMIAIYRGNPEAFDGNINLLRSGAVLRLPDSGAIGGVDAGEAAAEVRRQSAAWSANRTGVAAPAEDARLRLVPPGEAPPATPGTGTAGAGTSSSGNGALQSRVDDLERQLAESRRLLDLRNAELARLQGQPTPAPTAVPAPPTQPAPAPAAEVPAPAPEPTPAVEPPAVATTPATPAPAAEPAPVTDDEGVLGLLKKFWYVPAALVLLLLAALGLRASRRRRESFDSSLGLGSTLEPSLRDTSADTLPLRKPNISGEDEARNFVVEESGAHERPAFSGGPARVTQRVEVDEPSPIETSLADQTASLDQGDPLAEADFHMAYGLYDQAADLVRLAIQREPARRDLRLKLLEVFFVWGNREQFLQTARDLAKTREQSQPGEWEKVVIMGKQLAPDDALFSQAASAGAGVAGVDLNLEGGQNRIDFDLLGEPSVEMGVDGGIDLDLGAALRDKDATGDALQLDPGTLDFPLDDPSRGGDMLAHTATTRQMAQPGLGGDNSPTINRAAENEGPTVEQPGLPAGETIRQKLDLAAGKFGSVDQTAELALDDLGLDLSALDDTDSPNVDDSAIMRGLESAEAPTLVAGLDDESRRMINDARNANSDGPTLLAPAPGASESESGTWLFDDKVFLDPSAETGRPAADGNATMSMPSLPDLPADASPTSRLRSLEGNVDFNVEELESTGRNEALDADGLGLDLDVGVPEASETGTFAATQLLAHEDLALPDLEPATMSEVGTKLDLARAYMDMGDPEGARSILFEVLQEGSAHQKQEAQRLLDSIPG